MKIALIGQKGIPAKNGGVERYVENLSTKLVEKGHEVLVYSRKSYSPGIKEFRGVKIISLPHLPGKNFEAISHNFLACLDLLFRKVDVINFHSIGPASLLWLVKLLKPGTPIVFTFQCQDYYHQKWGFFARSYLRFGEKVGALLANKIITISHSLTSYTKARYNKDSVYIPNGVNKPSEVPVQDIRRWGLEKDNYITVIGRLIKHKGIHYLLEAFKDIKTDKKLVIVGEGSYTDTYVQELYKLAEGNDNIIFTGNQTSKTLNELFSNAYAFVQASESEGLSIALLEAMSYRLPCLVSDIEANQEALADTGVFFENKNVSDLKTKLKYILNNPEEMKELGEKAYKRARKEYNWDDISDNIIKLYHGLLK